MRPIPNHPMYYINDTGNIWTRYSNRYLRPTKDKRGYPVVKLDGKGYSVHRLMGYTYLGLTGALTINHKNGVKDDNRLSNLEVLSNADNIRHAYREGIRTNGFGDSSRNKKLTESEVLFIKQFFGVLPNVELAKMFGVHKSTISKIKNGKNWRMLSEK